MPIGEIPLIAVAGAVSGCRRILQRLCCPEDARLGAPVGVRENAIDCFVVGGVVGGIRHPVLVSGFSAES
ncbi:hypothetical protein D3C73_1635950 [compost metagenome]